jgi:lipoprotein-anchoring transpeptidase ErfK/SrfK
MKNRHFGALLLAFIACGCIVSESSDSAKKPADTAAAQTVAVATVPDSLISIPFGDSASVDTTGLGSQLDSMPPLATDTGYKQITEKAVDAAFSKFPARIPVRGPLTLRLQILLDRANFSPGIIDGSWGKNAAKALSAFRAANGIDTTDKASIDQATYDKLATAGQSTPLVTTYEVTADDMQGPFLKIPNSVYDQAKLDCLCFSSPAEEMAEKFHTNQQMLKQLNPKVKLEALSAGTSLQVPNVAEPPAPSSAVAKVVISRKGFWTHALDASGNIVAHFPSTLGAGYDPSPTGDFHVTGIATDPTFNYQPSLMAEVPDTKPTAKLKPGPNSPVGTVWMALSKPHYGIHGTSAPETIGYANSHGCVRLTNWDAERLASLVKAGTPVQFQ